MTASNDRRGFLRGLAALPLVGGSVGLLGNPSAVAEPVTPELLEAYKTWLRYEQRQLAWDMAADPVFARRYAGTDRTTRFEAVRSGFFHVGGSGSYHGGSTSPSPYTRAALVLSTVGCDWRSRA